MPAAFVAKDAVLSCFANARGTAVVYDCGATVTTATPVHEGYAVQKAIVKSFLGGDTLDEQMLLKVTQLNAATMQLICNMTSDISDAFIACFLSRLKNVLVMVSLSLGLLTGTGLYCRMVQFK
mgnify:CR=1 FL=1